MIDKGNQVTILRSSVHSHRKRTNNFVELSKVQLFLCLHALFIGVILLYQSIWLFSKSTNAYCYAYNADHLLPRGIEPGTLVYHYKVNETIYRETTTRNGIPVAQTSIKVRYLPFFPAVSRPATFESTWLGFIIAWSIFFVITGMIFFIPNETMPANSFFYFTPKRPWIHMIVK